MRKKPEIRPLTELEGAALAHVVRSGACTPYAIKEAFRTSPSQFWSGSAGAVYPLVRRLVSRGLMAARRDRRDGRARRLVTATPAGRAALQSWLVDAVRAADMGFDPMRTRLYYSDLIAPRRLRVFVAEMAELLAMGGRAPASTLSHVKELHASWTRLRRELLAEFTGGVTKRPRGRKTR